MKVAKIFDMYTLAIATREINVAPGDILTVTQWVTDPETGQCLGGYDRLRVKVTDVFPQFCIAETYLFVAPSGREMVADVALGDDARVLVTAGVWGPTVAV